MLRTLLFTWIVLFGLQSFSSDKKLEDLARQGLHEFMQKYKTVKTKNDFADLMRDPVFQKKILDSKVKFLVPKINFSEKPDYFLIEGVKGDHSMQIFKKDLSVNINWKKTDVSIKDSPSVVYKKIEKALKAKKVSMFSIVLSEAYAQGQFMADGADAFFGLFPAAYFYVQDKIEDYRTFSPEGLRGKNIIDIKCDNFKRPVEVTILDKDKLRKIKMDWYAGASKSEVDFRRTAWVGGAAYDEEKRNRMGKIMYKFSGKKIVKLQEEGAPAECSMNMQYGIDQARTPYKHDCMYIFSDEAEPGPAAGKQWDTCTPWIKFRGLLGYACNNMNNFNYAYRACQEWDEAKLAELRAPHKSIRSAPELGGRK